MTPGFSPDVENRLTRAGWFPGRKVATESWRLPLEEEGFVFPEVVVRFLEEFNGLHLEHDGARVDVGRQLVEYDPVLAVGEVYLVTTWAARYGVGDAGLERLLLGHRGEERPL